ncbi:MAG: hypothetical protein WCW30_02945, partial [Candidatus Gracilibacteria bacterium]
MDLKKYLEEHINYELKMFYCSMLYLRKFKESDDEIGKYISLESFLLHGRNLADFFFKKKKGNYVRAMEYFNEDIWGKIKPLKSSKMKNFMIRANNELAHLTIERKSGKLKEKEWDVSDIFLEFCKCVKLFFNNLPDQ